MKMLTSAMIGDADGIFTEVQVEGGKIQVSRRERLLRICDEVRGIILIDGYAYKRLFF